MQKTTSWMLAGILSLGAAAIAQTQQASGAAEKAVAALEEKWALAERTNNYDSAAPLLADKFVLIDPAGKTYDRAETIKDGKATKFTSSDVEDLKVTLFGDTAIARGTWKSKGTGADGKAFDSHSRWTDTWVKMPDGTWQCVAAHGSELKK
jgi:ketosteroid isomerase-like protein